MKRVYSALRPALDQKSYIDWITKCNQILSVSSKGLIAFTSSYCINQPRPTSTSYHVYVADINQPYQAYLLVDSEYDFTIVEWDPSGTKLLICDVRGCATIYTSKEYLISDWKPYFQKVFAAETFITAGWYHPGIVCTINVANQNLKTPSNHMEYSEKIQPNKHGASLRLFGGKSAEGCILVSRTGLVCCLTLINDGTVDVISDSLAPLRLRLEVADICNSKDGSFVVGTSAGNINSTISFYQINLSLKNLTLDDVDPYNVQETKRVQLTCKQFYSFHLNVVAQILSERDSTTTFDRVAHVKFLSKDCPDDVLIEVCGKNLSLIELWELEPRKRRPVHSVILEMQGNQANSNNIATKPEENGQNISPDFKEWCFKGNYITDKDLVTIHTPKFKLFGQSNQLNVILLAYKDCTVSCLRKEDLQPICEPIDFLCSDSFVYNSSNCRLDGDATNSPYKNFNLQRGSNGKLHNKSGRKSRPVYITDLQLTCNQAAFVAIDTMSQIHVAQAPTLLPCQDVKDRETYLQYLLEYCLVTGNDWWDVLICAGADSISNISEKFYDAYEKQQNYVKKQYYNRQLMIRASLLRCLNNVPSLCKAADCHTMVMLNSISNTLKSMLRSQDQDCPSENLAKFFKSQANNPNFYLYNNVITSINEKDFQIEVNLIQFLQPLTQWVVDLAIFLIASVPQRNKSDICLPGAGLATNSDALTTIRELLFIIKVWSLQNESVLPVAYKLSDQVDILSNLFKLISISHDNLLKHQQDPSFIDDCLRLSNSISIPQFSFVLRARGVASSLLFKTPEADYITMEYFKCPSMPELVPLPKLEGAINMGGDRKIDIVRNISLGAHPVANLRHCTRCNAVSLTKPAFPATRTWEQRWINCCVCGGSWAQSEPFANKVSHLAWLNQSPSATTSLAVHPHSHGHAHSHAHQHAHGHVNQIVR